ncbi:hypothetical protein LJR289_000512 [Pseudoduganella sp. LjRoot289]|uniref:hypothetical protein n=1 Tax=Pseudoduganella sp. LjRoot289 TaxID=3342314 RepID=UPI003ED0B631
MYAPKRIEEITVEDLRLCRWCYFCDDNDGFDGFEWAIPELHQKFSTAVVELELATFRFKGGQEFDGMFDGSKSFSVYLQGRWHSLWRGEVRPSAAEVAAFNSAISELSLSLPIVATARWSGKSECYGGLRYYDQDGAEVEA